MDMQIGGKFPQLPKSEDDALTLALDREPFKKAVRDIRKKYGIDPKTSKRLWRPIKELIYRDDWIARFCISDFRRPLERLRGLDKDFYLRWYFFWPCVPERNSDVSPMLGKKGQNVGAGKSSSKVPSRLLRKLIAAGVPMKKSPSAPKVGTQLPDTLRLPLLREPRPLSVFEQDEEIDRHPCKNDLEKWFAYYSRVTAEDIKTLLVSSRLTHLWDVLLLEHLIFDRPLREIAWFRPKAGVGFGGWERDENNQALLYVRIYRNTTIPFLKRQKDPLGRPFITAAAHMVYPEQKTPRPRIINCGDHLKVGPLPHHHALEALLKRWPKIRRQQNNMKEGLKKVRLKKQLERDKLFLNKLTSGMRPKAAYDSMPLAPTPDKEVELEAHRQATHRLKKQLN